MYSLKLKLSFLFIHHKLCALLCRKITMICECKCISQIQDAAPVLGDRVAVIGQGLIGVLTGV